MNDQPELGDYQSVTDGTMTITSNVPFSDADMAAPEPAPAEAKETPAATAADPAPASPARAEDGRFVGKPKEGNPRHDPRARVQQATSEAAEAKRLRDEAAKERDDARRERDEARRELESLRRPKAPEPTREQPKQVAKDDGRPDFSDASKYPDGQYDRQYIEDLADWKADQRYRQNRQQEARAQAERQHQQRVEQNYLKGKTKYPDIEARLMASQAPMHPMVARHLMQFEDWADVVVHLLEHPDVTQRLATLHPVDQIGEIGGIRASVRSAAASSRGSAPTPPVSKASAPIQPLGGSARSSEPDDNDLSTDQLFARWEQQDRARARAKR